jgi:hypothetical protein
LHLQRKTFERKTSKRKTSKLTAFKLTAFKLTAFKLSTSTIAGSRGRRGSRALGMGGAGSGEGGRDDQRGRRDELSDAARQNLILQLLVDLDGPVALNPLRSGLGSPEKVHHRIQRCLITQPVFSTSLLPDGSLRTSESRAAHAPPRG